MALRDLVKRVRLVLDKKSADQTEADTRKSLSGVEKGLDKVKAAAVKLGTALAAAFAVRKIINFGKEAVRVAAEADAIWTRLAQAVDNTGVSFNDVEQDVRQFARAMQDATTVGDEDFAAILTELITTSGDYGRSVQNVGVVADLAAAKQIDFRAAAQLVGRAMVGQTATLTRYGIVVKEGEDAVEAIRKSFRGFAEQESRSLQGQLKQLNNEWQDFKQAIGEALVAGVEGESILDRLTEAVKRLTGAVQKYVDAAAGIPQTFKEEDQTIRQIVTGSETAEQAINRLRRIRELEVGRLARAETELDDLPGLLAILATGRNYWEWRARVEDAKDAVEGYRMTIGKLDRTIQQLQSGALDIGAPGGAGTPEPPTTPNLGAGAGAEPPAPTVTDFWKQYPAAMLSAAEAGERMTRQKEGWKALNSEMEVSADNAARIAANLEKVGEGAQASQAQIMAMGLAASTVGDVVGALLGGDIGRVAAFKARENAILAAEQLAQAAAVALFPGIGGISAGAHLKAAAMFSGVAAMWGALAGATGGGGGAGGARGSPRDIGGAASERVGPGGPEVHIYLEGEGFDAVNPRVQRVVYGAVQEINRNYGTNAQPTIRRRSR